MKKILIVEDSDKLLMAFGIALKAAGYDVATAHDAVTAVSEARKANPDVAVLDVFLPGGDGFVVAERLKALPEFSEVPLIFVTASKLEGLRERAEAQGAACFMEKPFGSKELIAAIESALDSVEHATAASG